MKHNKDTIFKLLCASDTDARKCQRTKENPVYQDSSGTCTASRIKHTEQVTTEKEDTDAGTTD
ncbi:MAG: hypothetical protein RSF90_02760 [Pygmaiobacter sp.]